jgi:hypothetical protein
MTDKEENKMKENKIKVEIKEFEMYPLFSMWAEDIRNGEYNVYSP